MNPLIDFGKKLGRYTRPPPCTLRDIEDLVAKANGMAVDNITDRASKQFKDHYQPEQGKQRQPISKEAIFQYFYAVLHNPMYRSKYGLNLNRDFPRIPLYCDSIGTLR